LERLPRGQLDSARQLLAQAADLNSVGHNQLPLDAATRKGHNEIIALLRAEGAASHKAPGRNSNKTDDGSWDYADP
jgi:hypothetical protein